MRAASLCSGIGGLDLAVHHALGAEPAWFCESDPHCARILERRWPRIPVLPDVREIDAGHGPVDVLHAGYPCQPFSFAGKRQGENDPRHLWPAVRDTIRVLRPRLVVLENVAGHLRLGFDTVLADLADLGMAARWGVVRAADVGAPHRRARLFVDAYADGVGRSEPVGSRAVPTPGDSHALADAERGGRDGRPPHQGRRPEPRTAAERTGEGAAADPERLRGRPQHEPDLGLRIAGAEREPAADPGELDLRAGRRRRGTEGGDPAWAGTTTPTNPPGERDPLQPQEHGREPAMVRAVARPSAGDIAGDPAARVQQLGRDTGVEWGVYEPAIRRWEQQLGRPAPRPTDDRGRLMPSFVEWMMGFPQGWTEGAKRTHALRMLGNAVVPQQGELAIGLLAAGLHAARSRP